MASKKILLLIFAGIFLILIFGGFVSSYDVQKKIDWYGNLFEWNAQYYYASQSTTTSCSTFQYDGDNSGWHVSNDHWKFYECNKVNWYCVNNCGATWYEYSFSIPPSAAYLYISCTDNDNDNYSPTGQFCNTGDCDDSVNGADGIAGNADDGANRYPEATEICGNNIDEDCVGGDLVCPVSCSDIIDIDGDGFGLTGGGICNWQIDCDDNDPDRFPGNPEVCDGIDNDCNGFEANENIHSTTGTENSLSSCADGFDNDCDGLIDCADSSCPQTNCISCTNADNDNYCLESSGANCISTNVCAAFGDCEDRVDGADGIAGNADDGANRYPEATEICDDGIDNNCDTYTDFDAPFCWGAYWASDSQGDIPINTNINADGSQIVYLISKYPVFIDQYFATHDFEIYEENSLGEDDAIRTDALGNKLTKTDLWDRIVAEWTITQADITKAATDDSSDNVYEFYFNISNPTSVIAFQSPILIVDWTPAPCTSGTQSCYTGALETEGIGVCIGGTQICANSVWGVCQGEIKPTTEICGDGKDNDCDDEVDEETCSPTPVDCAQYQLCFDADSETACTEADSCGVSSLNGCLWNSGVCNPYEDLVDNSNNVIGQCVYTEDITDTCEDGGTLTYSLTTLTQGCEDKKDVSIFCSAQTSLPLENKFGIFLTIISIIGIYFIFFRIKKILKYKK